MKTIKLTLILIIFIISCKDKPREPVYCLMSQEFKDYVVFTEGDYWVYKSNTGLKDSVVLIKQEITSEQMEEQHSNNKFEELKQTFITNNSDTFIMRGSLYSFGKCIYVYGQDNCNNYSSFCKGLFFNASKIGENISNNEYIKYYDTLSVNGIVYPNVRVYSFGNVFKYYYAKNIGLIKRENNDIVWEIEKYSINQ